MWHTQNKQSRFVSSLWLVYRMVQRQISIFQCIMATCYVYHAIRLPREFRWKTEQISDSLLKIAKQKIIENLDYNVLIRKLFMLSMNKPLMEASLNFSLCWSLMLSLNTWPGLSRWEKNCTHPSRRMRLYIEAHDQIVAPKLVQQCLVSTEFLCAIQYSTSANTSSQTFLARIHDSPRTPYNFFHCIVCKFIVVVAYLPLTYPVPIKTSRGKKNRKKKRKKRKEKMVMRIVKLSTTRFIWVRTHITTTISLCIAVILFLYQIQI